MARRRTGAPKDSAEAVGLRYVSDLRTPGIRRIRHTHRVRYVDAHGRTIGDRAVLRRIRSLVIPPAWKDVWICPNARGHLQATGRDARGRKQYRYHPRWRAVRDEVKYGRLLAFARALPRTLLACRALSRLSFTSKPQARRNIVRAVETVATHLGNTRSVCRKSYIHPAVFDAYLDGR